MRTDFRVVIALILAMIFWAFSFVWVKIAYEVFNPLTTVMLRLIISSAFLFISLGLMKKIQKIDPIHFKWFLLMAFFEPFLYFMGESFGLKVVSSILASVIVSTIPLFAPILGYLLFREKISLMNLIGILVSFFGVAFIVIDGDFSIAVPWYGIALMFLAVFSALGYSVILKKLTGHYNSFTIISYQNLIGIIFVAPFFAWFEWHDFISTPITKKAIVAVIELSIFASALAFIFFTYGIRRIGITRSNVFVNMIPVFTALFAWYLLDDPMTMKKVMGIAIAISGLFVSQIKYKTYGIPSR